MIIDFHTHTFPPRSSARIIAYLADKANTKPYNEGSAAELAASMKEAGVDLSVNLPVLTDPSQDPKVNDHLLAQAEELAAWGIVSFAGMHPDCPEIRSRVRELRRQGFAGVKLHPPYVGRRLTDPGMMRIMDAAAEEGMIILVHGGLDPGFPGCLDAGTAAIEEVLRTLSPPRLVIAHMGGWMLWDEVEKYLAGGDFYMDTAYSVGPLRRADESRPLSADESRPLSADPSAPLQGAGESRPLSADPSGAQAVNLSEEAFLRLARKHGTDRILFGTDSPWSDQKEFVTLFRQMALTDEERRAILGGNALRLLKEAGAVLPVG